MQTAHYSITEIIITDATDNDTMGKNAITYIYRQQFNIYLNIPKHLFNILNMYVYV